ncbi:MAG: tRNA uridine-5-carboxymethylaminomethyl(34) synthesis GTPase MnmE [Sideroxydans sp.]|nr:tRNA uridine-5-carboxymethylaminomethyl(34) synthesis GTPase MnmE [Sideroxydans sp.]
MQKRPDIIAAIATAPGRGGIGIVRISGFGLERLSNALTGRLLEPRVATYTPFFAADNSVLDQGIALYFPAPHSYTGEEVLELQGHGGQGVLELVLQRCLALGARLAQPGEFTERAFMNDKMDLAQAESVADLIEATTQQAARSAVRSLQGDFSNVIHSVVKRLIDLRMYVEATLDFPEEEGVVETDTHKLAAKIDAIQGELRRIGELAKQGSILREGAQVVLVGAPNVGKSSLMNRLAGEEVALVSDIAGTTRDAIRQVLQINGVPLHIIDTAGLRETEDVVERLGMERTQQNIERADLVLVLIDSANPNPAEIMPLLARIPNHIPRLFVHNKIDLTQQVARVIEEKGVTHLYLSAKADIGIEALRECVLQTIGWRQEAGVFMARTRHLVAIDRASEHLDAASQQLEAQELLAEELRHAQLALNQITGEFVADDLLGEIFSRFCIGK